MDAYRKVSVIDGLMLIDNVIVDYVMGRRMGLSDDEVEK